jgi:hypothetical protein
MRDVQNTSRFFFAKNMSRYTLLQLTPMQRYYVMHGLLH